MADASRIRGSAGDRFLLALPDPERGALPFRVAIVVAHPDDETIGCGALLPRLADLEIFHLTNGSPRNGRDAAALGFEGPAAYAATRRRELETAAGLAGVAPERLVWLGLSDQEASLHLVELVEDLSRRLAGYELVLTHAYEGGHPDHDSAAFAVHAACNKLRSRGAAPAVVEMPLYRWGPDGWANQSFAPESGADELVLELTPAEQDLKRAMFAAHASQSHVLERFSVDTERFRKAPHSDFSALPNGGELLYERMNWGMTGARWLELAGEAMAKLRLGAAA